MQTPEIITKWRKTLTKEELENLESLPAKLLEVRIRQGEEVLRHYDIKQEVKRWKLK